MRGLEAWAKNGDGEVMDLRPAKRRKLPKKRKLVTNEAKIGYLKVYITTGEYPDGSLGELFLDLKKPGSTLQGLLTCFAISVSLGLQHGVALEKYVRIFKDMKFEPSGKVKHESVKEASSVVDLVFRVIENDYLKREA